MPKLTKRAVEALPVEAKDYFVWDSQIAGFGVRVMPSGAKTYQAQYRKGGRTRRVSIGRHGKITVDEWRNSNSFHHSDLLNISKCAERAEIWIGRQTNAR
ncbi:Arm DNA-binding domain-containing protein [uncultured Ruegeria sp.]|uniref:Arm DNA-binding domain-containing protein n=1 Tax=uncultured Ruegeria sp. TaxID=259304 RepID=UPI0026224A44|nr:Arm DNA-binding domain-containing protein [uncultured Ruegeria sp.]